MIKLFLKWMRRLYFIEENFEFEKFMKDEKIKCKCKDTTDMFQQGQVEVRMKSELLRRF